MRIGDIARVNAERFKEKIALRDEKRTVSFQELNRRINALCNALLDLGVSKGDRVAILLCNCVAYNELLLGLPKAGFVIVPLNYRLVGNELKYLINNAEAKVLVAGGEYQDTVNEIREDLDTVEFFISVGDRNPEAHDYETLIDGASDREVPAQLSPEDLAYILYTSGTTGRPKGAMLTHKNVLTNMYNQSFELQPKVDDTLFNLPPLYHCAGQCTMMSYFFYGCTSMTIKQFDVGMVLQEISEWKPNIVHLVPAMQNMVINHSEILRYDLSCVDLMIYGASSMPVAQLKRAMEIFGCDFIQCAGQTEASPILTILRPEAHVTEGVEELTRRLGSAGKEVKLTEVRIVDRNDIEVPPDTPGEQVARGDNVMKGYWKLPEATAETIVDGWLHTGDICTKDEGGYVYYVDRIKDMIIRGGENVYPREIEEVIAGHPSVFEVAVIGVPDERLGEEIMAVISLKKGHKAMEKEIATLCEDSLARYKKPRHLRFLDALPKNPSGKILKKKLREQFVTKENA
ncbi:putative long-chain-fatty-acid--CoA ligase [delta proteobacterium NaphS2]|nr:putative long-chain-fatty-acid--CoA ligase [delta proteobacterium NaphS2]